MPLVKSIDVLADGFRIVTTQWGTVTITSNDLSPAQKAMTPAQLEASAKAFLDSRLPVNMFVGLHLTSVVPLQGIISIGNAPFLANWWQTP